MTNAWLQKAPSLPISNRLKFQIFTISDAIVQEQIKLKARRIINYFHIPGFNSKINADLSLGFASACQIWIVTPTHDGGYLCDALSERKSLLLHDGTHTKRFNLSFARPSDPLFVGNIYPARNAVPPAFGIQPYGTGLPRVTEL
jgi:hypothetical protein